MTDNVAGAGYRLTAADIDRMLDKLLFAGADLARKHSASWVPLGLAGRGTRCCGNGPDRVADSRMPHDE